MGRDLNLFQIRFELYDALGVVLALLETFHSNLLWFIAKNLHLERWVGGGEHDALGLVRNIYHSAVICLDAHLSSKHKCVNGEMNWVFRLPRVAVIDQH